MKFFYLIGMVLMASICYATLPIEEMSIFPGKIIYVFDEGELEVLMEKDENNQIFILLKNLKANTSFEFVSLLENKDKMILNIKMLIKEKKLFSTPRIKVKPISLSIDPLKVKSSRINGPIIYEKDNITIFSDLSIK